MLRRIMAIFGLVCLFALVAAMPASAGGWANVTLDRLPADLQAGQAITIGFMVRQHGVTPTNAVQPYLSARHLESGRTAYFPARQEGPVGHYVADVSFPTAGAWEWEAVPDPFPTPTKLGTLTVLPAAAAPSRAVGDSPALVTIAITPQVALRVVGGAPLARPVVCARCVRAEAGDDRPSVARLL